ncbi:DNA polymerase IV [Geobacter sp.]|uniref:DNA polymerase IV n=1 Tax=Geobacter sp. TaxID=46610 RepID=UPI0027B981B4|nr:DNA polymerase IV [Geobacter sp.]
MPEPRVIMHLDLNAFFASVEQQANPELQGKPIAVVGGNGRTVITTSSYEARAFGVKTGMAKWEALRVCPQLIIVVGDNKKYCYTSSRIMEMMRDYTPFVEVFSIDEAWMDVTHSLSIFGTPERIAYLLKARIKESFGLLCSIGIAPNKLLAKLASDMKKPDGLTVIHPEDVNRVLERLPISELCGIGKKMGRHFAMMSIRTCGELGRADEARLTKKFGILGKVYKQMGQGIDYSPVSPAEEDDEVKSVGHSMTLPRDVDSREDILRYLLQLSEMVGRRARRYGVSGRTVHLHVRFADFYSNVGKQNTLTSYINMSDEIFKASVRILDTLELLQPIRQLGVRLTNLKFEAEQLSLFRDVQKRNDAIKAMDTVNDRFGEFRVTFGSLMNNEEKGSHVISPAWRPEGIRNVDVS